LRLTNVAATSAKRRSIPLQRQRSGKVLQRPQTINLRGITMEKSEHALESADWLDNAIKDFIATSPENSLQDKTNERAWDEPLVGFSNGADPIYQGYKQNVGEFHWTPLEIFSEIYPDLDVSPEDLTIISWVLPHSRKLVMRPWLQP